MNDIKIITLFKLYSSYSNMAEGVGSAADCENGSIKNQITRHLSTKASQAELLSRNVSQKNCGL